MQSEDNFDAVTSQEDEDVSSAELVSSAPTPVRLTTDGPAELSGLRRSTRIRRPPKRYGQESSDT